MSPRASSPERVPTPPDAPLQAWLDQATHARAACRQLGAARLRVAAKARARGRLPGPGMATVEDHDLGGHLTARLYRPAQTMLPLVLYFHGGGFVLGDLETHDRLARRLAAHAQVAVLTLDYRRAPEHRAPAALEDAVRAAQWATTMSGLLGADRRTGLCLGGDEAGGLLALATAQRLRELSREGPYEPAGGLLLLTPLVDLTLTTASTREKGHGYGIETDDLAWFVEQWLPPDADRLDPAISPAYGPLHGMPPAFVVTAEHDPLRDDGRWVAERLAGAGGAVAHRHYTELVHGFCQLDDISPACEQAADGAFARFGEFLRGAHGLGPA